MGHRKLSSIEQQWAWIVLGLETTWELQVLLAKTNAGLHCGKHVSHADGRCQRGHFTEDSPFECTLPLVICTHNFHSCVISIG